MVSPGIETPLPSDRLATQEEPIMRQDNFDPNESLPGPSGVCRTRTSQQPSAPDLQLDWISSDSSDNEDGLEVLMVRNNAKPEVVDLTQEPDEDVIPNQGKFY